MGRSMAKNTKLVDLETRPVWRLLAEYSLPAIVGMAAMSVFNIVDSIYVGQWCGAYAITAMALVFPLMNLQAAVGSLVGLGCAATASITLGQGDFHRAFRVLGHCVMLSALTGLVAGVAPVPWLGEILVAFGAEGETLEPAYDFMLVMMLCFPITCAFMNLNHLMRATGYPVKAMVSMLISMVVNIGTAPIYIYVLGWGVRGAALATATAQVVGLVWIAAHFVNRRSVLHLRRGIYKLNGVIVRRVLGIGLPPCLLNIGACVIVVVFNHLFLAYDGEMGVGAYGVVNRVLFFFVMVVLGITQGLQPIAGYNLGVGNYCRVRRVLYCAMAAATCVTCLGTLLVEVFPREIVSVFVKEADANAARLIDIAAQGICLMAACFPLVGSQIVIGNFFQSIGRPVLSISLNLTRQVFFLLPCLAVLPLWVGEPGIWASQAVADGLSALLGFTVLYVFFRRAFHRRDIQMHDCVPDTDMMKTQTLILATRNAHKAQEIAAILPPHFEVKTLADFPNAPEIEETGRTFAANAAQKAEGISAVLPGLVLADDSGLCVDALNGSPGVISARYAGTHGDDAANNRKLLAELRAMPAAAPYTARFVCAMCLACGGAQVAAFEGKVEGTITLSPRGTTGFGYDPLFVPAGHQSTFAEIPSAAKNAISHRSLALAQLVEYLESQGNAQ